jgi:hypothetical protein
MAKAAGRRRRVEGALQPGERRGVAGVEWDVGGLAELVGDGGAVALILQPVRMVGLEPGERLCARVVPRVGLAVDREVASRVDRRSRTGGFPLNNVCPLLILVIAGRPMWMLLVVSGALVKVALVDAR